MISDVPRLFRRKSTIKNCFKEQLVCCSIVFPLLAYVTYQKAGDGEVAFFISAVGVFLALVTFFAHYVRFDILVDTETIAAVRGEAVTKKIGWNSVKRIRVYQISSSFNRKPENTKILWCIDVVKDNWLPGRGGIVFTNELEEFDELVEIVLQIAKHRNLKSDNYENTRKI